VLVGGVVGVALVLAEVVSTPPLGNGSSTRGAGDGEFGPTGSVGLDSVGVGDADREFVGELDGAFDLLGCVLGAAVGPVVGAGRLLAAVVGATVADADGPPEPGG
jgi:hypothetical protein